MSLANDYIVDVVKFVSCIGVSHITKIDYKDSNSPVEGFYGVVYIITLIFF